jgi:hypothetical protein
MPAVTQDRFDLGFGYFGLVAVNNQNGPHMPVFPKWEFWQIGAED